MGGIPIQYWVVIEWYVTNGLVFDGDDVWQVKIQRLY